MEQININIQINIHFPEQLPKPPVQYIDWKQTWRYYPYSCPYTYFPGKYVDQSLTVNQPLFIPIMGENFITTTGFFKFVKEK